MEIREVKPEEFDTLLNLMNLAFSFEKEENKFEHILPKLYNCPYISKENRHFAAFEDGKMVASVGLYPMTLCYKGRELLVACLGGVSTHPEYRLKGHFQQLIPYLIERAKELGYAFLFLGGDRFRYKRYGFEIGGKEAILSFSKREGKFLAGTPLDVSPMAEADVSDCLELYSHEKMTIKRTKENFLYVLKSWNGIPYVLKENGKIVGYISLVGESDVQEFVYQKEVEDQALLALLSFSDRVKIHLPASSLDETLLGKVNSVSCTFAEQYLILDFEKLENFLGYKGQKYTYENSLERTRKLLGSPLGDSILLNSDFYIYLPDRG